MANEIKEYKKLPGKKKRFWGYNTLYKGDDHLLAISSHIYVESYRRFYFKDIQSIVTRKTESGKVQNILFIITAGLFALLAFFVDDPAGLIFLMVIASIFVIGLLFNLWMGPTCLTHIYTAVQREELPSLSRKKNFEKVMQIIRPEIQQAQNQLTVDTASMEIPMQTEKAPPTLADHQKVKAAGAYSGAMHKSFFIAFGLHGLVMLSSFVHNSVGMTIIGTLAALTAATLLIIALVRQHDSDLSPVLKKTSWACMAIMIFTFCYSYILFFITAANNPESSHLQWEMLKLTARLTPYDHPVMLVFHIILTSLTILPALAGLLLMQKEKDQDQAV